MLTTSRHKSRVGLILVDHPERSFSKAKFCAESENDIENFIKIPPRVVPLNFSKWPPFWHRKMKKNANNEQFLSYKVA